MNIDKINERYGRAEFEKLFNENRKLADPIADRQLTASELRGQNNPLTASGRAIDLLNEALEAAVERLEKDAVSEEISALHPSIDKLPAGTTVQDILQAKYPNQGEFYMVYNPAGRAPVVRHATPEAAIAEAQRLAKQSPGQYYVLTNVVAVVSETVVGTAIL